MPEALQAVGVPEQAFRDSVHLAKCRYCGHREFTLRFQQAKIRYTILADCVTCGRSRVLSLDAAHKATKATKRQERSRDQ